MWGSWPDRVHRLLQNRHARYGVPFVGLLLLGSFGLREFATVRYEFRTTKKFAPEDLEKATGLKVRPKEERSLEYVFEEHVAQTAGEDDDYEMVRGPRPWEAHPQADKVKEKVRVRDVLKSQQ